MGFSHSLSQAFFIALYIIPQEEGVILELFCVTSLVSKNFQATCKIKVSKFLVISGTDSTINCIIGRAPWKPGGSSFVWIQACPFFTYFGSAFWRTLERNSQKDSWQFLCEREKVLWKEHWHFASFVNNSFTLLPYTKNRK